MNRPWTTIAAFTAHSFRFFTLLGIVLPALALAEVYARPPVHRTQRGRVCRAGRGAKPEAVTPASPEATANRIDYRPGGLGE